MHFVEFLFFIQEGIIFYFYFIKFCFYVLCFKFYRTLRMMYHIIIYFMMNETVLTRDVLHMIYICRSN